MRAASGASGAERRTVEIPLRSRKDHQPDPPDTIPTSDSRRLGELLQQLQPRLTAVALRFTRDPDSARDVVQNAFLKVVRHGDQFQGNARPSTWIHRIVTNEALMWLRTEKRRGANGFERLDEKENLLVDRAPWPDEIVSRRQSLDQLRRGLAALRPEEREVLQKSTLQERSYSQVGRELGIHPAAAKSRAFRARRRLDAFLHSA